MNSTASSSSSSVIELLPTKSTTPQLTKSKSFGERWIDFVDSGLRLFLSESKVKKVWRLIYRYNLWRTGGVLIGGLLLTLSMQSTASAQLFNKAKSSANTTFGGYLGNASKLIELFFGSGQQIIFVVGIGVVTVGLYDMFTSQGARWHIWGGIVIALILGYAAFSAWEGAVFG